MNTNDIYSLVNDDLTNMSDNDIEHYISRILTLHAGHPAGSTSHAQSTAVLEKLRTERERRNNLALKNESSMNLIFTKRSFWLNIIILIFSILALLVAVLKK